MLRLYPNEQFREVEIDYPLRHRYAISNRGRLISFKENTEDGILLKGGLSSGYRSLRYKMTVGKKTVDKTILTYKLVAQFFIPRTSEDQTHVIHLDYSRDNDVVSNLKWVTFEEMLEHRRKNPKVMALGKMVTERNIKADGAKLTSTKVMHLKKLLNDPNRKTRLKMLAKQFGVSEMQICRIKRGENWGHIKV